MHVLNLENIMTTTTTPAEAPATKTCARCQIEKSIDNFWHQADTRDGYGAWCRECHYEQRRQRQERAGTAAGVRARAEARAQARAAEDDRRRAYGPGIRAFTAVGGGVPREMAERMYDDAKKRARRLGVPFGLTVEYILELLQTGRCALTGLPWIRMNGLGSSNPYSPTLDRIVPELGYVPGNVRVVLHAVNAARGRGTDQELLAAENPRTLRALFLLGLASPMTGQVDADESRYAAMPSHTLVERVRQLRER